MKKQTVHRQYNFPDADLYLLCMERIRDAHRDLTYFEQYGYSLDRLKGFKALCDQLHTLPDDDELVGEQMLMTEKKDTASEKLKTAVRSLMTRVAMKYNNRSGRYRKFGTAKMGDMTDAQLLFCGRRVVRVARQQIDFLAEVGVNETQIQRVVDAHQEFENALNIQQDKIADRDISVERRIEQGNKLYMELIVLCNIGKDIWAEKDLSKYESYTIYESNNDQKIARKEKLSAI
jgi:ribosomal protein L17